MLHIDLTPGPVPILLYPHRSADESALPPKDTIFTSTVEITAEDERIKIGSIIAVWQSSIIRSEYPKPEGTQQVEGEWEVLNTILVNLQEDETTLSADEKRSFVFDLTIPPNLPLATATPWERVSHVLYVFVLAPSPGYSVLPPILTERTMSPASRASVDFGQYEGPSSPSPSPSLRRTSLIDSLRRLSYDSISSMRSNSSQTSSRVKKKGKGKDREMTDGQDEDAFAQSQPPFPQLEEPYIAETHIPVVVTASPDVPGRVRDMESRRDLTVEGFGRIQVNMYSDMFIIGSGIMACFYLFDLDPGTTLHAVRMSLTQRLTSVDGSTTHCDQYNLFQLGETYHLGRPPESDIVWRGSGARVIDKIARSKGKKRVKDADEAIFPDSDRIHITCGPRIPSWAMGLRPSAAYHTPGMSTIDHELDVSFFWSIDSLDAENSPLSALNQDGGIRTTSIKFHPIINSCAFLFSNIVTPTYSTTPAPQGDTDAYMAPYTPGTEPRSFGIRPMSWVEKDGKRQRLTHKKHDQQSTDLRRHQEETGGLCACFYADCHRAWEKGYKHTPLVVNGELDLAPFKPVKGGKANFAVERKRREQEWWDVHKREREAVPGFLNMLFNECACEAFRRGSSEVAEGQNDPNRKGSLGAEAV